MKHYRGYKEGTNSRGLPSAQLDVPEHFASTMETDNNFVEACKRATENINSLIESGHIPAPFWNSRGGSCGAVRQKGSRNTRGSVPVYQEVKPTSRQYRKYRNGHGLAYNYRSRV